MFRKFAVLIAVFVLGGTVIAGPFFPNRPRLFNPPPSCGPQATPSTPSTTPLPEFSISTAHQEKEVPVPQPYVLTWATVDTSLLQPDTVLDPVPGTGSKSPTTPKAPEATPSKLDPNTIKIIGEILKEVLKDSSPGKAPVVIKPEIPETLQPSPLTSTLLQILLSLGVAFLTIKTGGAASPLGALLVNGLRSILQVKLQEQPQTRADQSSTPPKE